jgi:predicted O-linked N-acetylglucosamine transferase (SPINDLY family)
MGVTPFNDPRLLKAFRALEQAVSFQQNGLFDDADRSFARIVKKTPDYFDGLHLYGLFKYQRGQFDDALRLVQKAVKVNPRSANALSSLGVIQAHIKRYGEAVATFNSALAIDPHHLLALSNLCNALNELGRFEDAIAVSDRALAISQTHADVFIPRGAALLSCRRNAEALDCYERALRLNPGFAVAWLGRGNTFFELKRYDEAIATYDRAIALDPASAKAWLGRGNVFNELKDYDQAFVAYDRAFKLDPGLDTVEGARLHCKMHVCDWSDFAQECAHLIVSLRQGRLASAPFPFLAVPSSAEEQLLCAQLFAAKKYPPSGRPLWRGDIYKHDRIRIAYVSADFHQHATAYLMAGMFEFHDKAKFELTGISIGPDDTSEMRQRLKTQFADFIDAQSLGDQEIAQLVRAAEIDILVDLKGFTQNARTGIFTRHPAPIQVNYLGYPGTMGADYYEYIVADRMLIPEPEQRHYKEKIVYLPNSYQVNDAKRPIAETAITRADAGLPPSGFVFCCFNNTYKIVPEVFDTWMRIMKAVDGSVLWLFEANASAAANLRREAEARGVGGERLVFAKKLPLPEHLARHRLADLFLDTVPCNAHTTASDALWACLPVLTQLGGIFAGRVAASLLNAIGLDELVAPTLQDYERLAIELATRPDKLAHIKHKLSDNRLTAPLFNTALYTRHIEAAYVAMYERQQAGLPPQNIAIAT